MGFLIKFLLVFVTIYFLLKGFASFLLGKRGRQTTPRQPQRPEQGGQPVTQEERIIEYQKKTFEVSDAEDVEFVEIKGKKGEGGL